MFVEVILPLPLHQFFTYRLPEELKDKVSIGARVIVQFGRKKIYSAIVRNFTEEAPEHYEVKDVLDILDASPIITEHQLKFWEWIAEYYCSTVGEVYKAAVPSALKIESETVVTIHHLWENEVELHPKEEAILTYLNNQEKATITEIDNALQLKNILPYIKSLLEKNAILIHERLKEGYKIKTEKTVILSSDFQSEDEVRKLFDKLSRAPKQLEVLMAYLSMLPQMNQYEAISRNSLLEKFPQATQALNELIKKNIFEVKSKEIDRILPKSFTMRDIYELSAVQQTAKNQIEESFKTFDTTLLFGVTSSGKTEIYIHLIQELINQGKQVLYLLPEIALTTQITSRLQQVFGNQLGIYHSKFSDAERVEVWNKVLQNRDYKVIIGVRSSIFLPFQNLGLIIVDEEHENSFKQYDPAPRYNARDASIVLGKMHKAKVLLGSATPSFESFYNAQNQKFGLVELTTRHQDIQMPEIVVADIADARKKKQLKNNFTPLLLNTIDKALKDDEQVILFQNRRGFAPYVECGQCAWIPKCNFCDVSLTYHKHKNQLVCHYCGHTIPLMNSCMACGSPTMGTKGFGTEKIEEDIKEFFPEIAVERMDLDTTRTKTAHEKIIERFEEKKIDILIGTQMISKGLDFDRVSVVGILNADNMLNFPDFRAFERSFQLMSQVSGRAGRKYKRGLVILQSSTPDHPVIADVVKNDYLHFYNTHIQERKDYHYPPFTRIFEITVKNRDAYKVEKAAVMLAHIMKESLANRVLGPQAPVINKIQDWYLRKIILKMEKTASHQKVRIFLFEAIHAVLAHPDFKSSIIQIDVDPC